VCVCVCVCVCLCALRVPTLAHKRTVAENEKVATNTN
jgi:hypothetical protein